MRSYIISSLVLLALILNAGCASESGSGTPSTDGTAGATGAGTVPTAPTGSTAGGTTPIDSYTGSTVPLTVASGALDQMFYNSNPNSPTNVKLNIDLTRSSTSVVISYVDNGVVHEAALGSVHPYNPSISDTSLNGWVTNPDGSKVWKGFFQDSYGAIVVILDSTLSTGDGQTGVMGGSIWFQNFNQYYPNNPLQGNIAMCWQITAGPYDCRTFIQGGHVVPGSSKYPNNYGPNRSQGYTKLGDFVGLNVSSAGM